MGKIDELARVGAFRAGTTEGLFADNARFSWRVRTSPTDIPSCFRVAVQVAWPGGDMEIPACLREKGQ